MEVEKAPWRRQWPLVSSSWPAIFSTGSQGLRLQAAREAGGSRPGGPDSPDYCTIWEELNASIFASEWRLWEQNHRKRKKPARKRLVSGSVSGTAWGLLQDPGTSLTGVSGASLRPSSNSQKPFLLEARRDRA